MTRIFIVMLLVSLVAVGCVVLSEHVTPTSIDKAAIKYAIGAGVADANDYCGYANLYKANKLAAAVKAAYEINVLAIDQLRERHELDYNILNAVVTRNTKIGKQREAAFFGEKGLLSMGLGLLGVGGLGGLIGLRRKRPGDFTPADVADKDRQMLEVVQGVKTFIDTKIPAAHNLKATLREKTSTDTKQVIAALQSSMF